jgi:hypothetical protein
MVLISGNSTLIARATQMVLSLSPHGNVRHLLAEGILGSVAAGLVSHCRIGVVTGGAGLDER